MKMTETKEQDITPSPECLKQYHLNLSTKIDSGTRGSLWALKQDDKHYLKFTSSKERDRNQASLEEYVSQLAGILGIGPPVYFVGKCEGNYYIVMKKLTGPSLISTYPFDSKYVVKALELYYELLKAGFDHRDFHAGNLLFDGNKFYLIDYGDAKPIHSKTKDLKPFMKDAIKSFIENLYFIVDSKEPIVKYEQLANDWLYNTFGDS
jgi:predicted Ser/Thr protein kinase